MRRRRVLVVLVVLALVALVAATALARPGGGGSFSGGGGGGGRSGGSSGSGSGSGGGGGDISGIFDVLVFVLQFIFDPDIPWQVKVGVFAAAGGGIVVLAVRGRTKKRDWTTMIDTPPKRAQPPRDVVPTASPRTELARIRAFDRDFSVVLFEDFLYTLYAEAKHALGRGQIALLSAYLAPDLLGRMKGAPPRPVGAVVIGAMRYVRVRGLEPNAQEVRVDVELESNVAFADPREPAAYLVERWTLARKKTARSRPPARARVLDCPSCGAPLTAVIAGTCTHCKRVVATGELDWIVRTATVVREERRPPLLTSDVEEQGTDSPTIVAPDAAAALAELGRKDPSFAWPAFQARVGLVFREFQTAWAARDLAKMRAYLSDNLFQMQSYWTQAYVAQHLRNVTENARIEKIELARVESDAVYDAITVRVRATGLDYTLGDDGRVVCGSKKKERRYTEYWTMIRGAARRGPTQTENACPNCGAPLEVAMAGTCKYCSAKVTSGEFDWVLSRIEQDEVYAG